jgi:hypothetical protein
VKSGRLDNPVTEIKVFAALPFSLDDAYLQAS